MKNFIKILLTIIFLSQTAIADSIDSKKVDVQKLKKINPKIKVLDPKIKLSKTNLINKLKVLDKEIYLAEGDLLKKKLQLAEVEIKKNKGFLGKFKKKFVIFNAKKEVSDSNLKLEELTSKRQEFIKTISEQLNSEKITTTQAALLTFLIKFRELHPYRYSIIQPSKADTTAEYCPDIIQDQILFDFVTAISVDNRPAYVASMAKVVQGLECYTMSDGLNFSENLALAYVSTLVHFDKKQSKNIERALLSSFANLFIIVQDLTKSFGPTPLYYLIKANRSYLGEVFATSYSPLRLSGYWIYEPSLSRLVKVKKLCEEGDFRQGKNRNRCVSGAATLDALVDVWRIGNASCSLSEMITAEFNFEKGYKCQRNVCGDTKSISGIELMKKSKQTPYGFNYEELKIRICDETDDSSDIKGKPGYVSGLVDFAQCVTEKLKEVGLGGEMRCAADAAKRELFPDFTMNNSNHDECENPLSQDNWVVKPEFCQGEGKNTNKCKIYNSLTNIIPFYNKIATGDSEVTDITDEEIKNAKFSLELLGNPLIQDRVFESEDESCERICVKLDGHKVVGIALGKTYLSTTPQEQIEKDIATTVENTRIIIQEFKDKLKKACEGEEFDDNPICEAWRESGLIEDDESGVDDNNQYCLPEVGNCNECSPIDSRQQALLDCFSEEQENPLDEDPGFIDPLPFDIPITNAGLAAWESCQTEEDNSSTECAHVDCEEGKVPDPNQNCNCVTPGEQQLQSNNNPCTHTDYENGCPDGSDPVPTPRGCFCDVDFEDGVVPVRPGGGDPAPNFSERELLYPN